MVTEPVGLSKNLPNQRVMQARIGETDIAVWRSASGKLAAWLNRCPHRGMRLSHGFVRGESLACLYHGWHYGGDGVCNYIPAHRDLDPPKTIQTTAFNIVEKGGVLWVSTDAETSAPSIAYDHKPVRSITLLCSLQRAIDAFCSSQVMDENDNVLNVCEVAGEANPTLATSQESAQKILILLQQPTQNSVIAHILAGGDWTIDGLVEISRWSEIVRRQTE